MTDTNPVTSADDDLDQWLAQQSMSLDDDEMEFSPPTSEPQTDRLLGVLRYLDRERRKVELTAATRIAEIRAWQDERATLLDGEVARIERLLEGWTRAEHKLSGGRTKTWKFPNGTLTIRPGRTRVAVLDEAGSPALLKQAGHGQLTTTTTTTTVDKKAVAAYAKGRQGPPVDSFSLSEPGFTAHHIIADQAGGEVLPGVYLLVPDDSTFKASPR